MTVGNDLSFPYSDDKKEREASFYADGDYRLNILNRRDEAKDKLGWMGFELENSALMPSKTMFNLKPYGTSRQLWVYKTWMEVQVGVFAEQLKFHFYNCSEAGILGVVARDHRAMQDKDNWYLVDELFPKRWHTRTLKKAFQDFVEARQRCLTPMATKNDALIVSPWQGSMGGARTVDPLMQLSHP